MFPPLSTRLLPKRKDAALGAPPFRHCSTGCCTARSNRTRRSRCKHLAKAVRAIRVLRSVRISALTRANEQRNGFAAPRARRVAAQRRARLRNAHCAAVRRATPLASGRAQLVGVFAGPHPRSTLPHAVGSRRTSALPRLDAAVTKHGTVPRQSQHDELSPHGPVMRRMFARGRPLTTLQSAEQIRTGSAPCPRQRARCSISAAVWTIRLQERTVAFGTKRPCPSTSR
jgi:hypothetical protein